MAGDDVEGAVVDLSGVDGAVVVADGVVGVVEHLSLTVTVVALKSECNDGLLVEDWDVFLLLWAG